MLNRPYSVARRLRRVLLTCLLIGASASASAVDTYDPATNVLTIPLVAVGSSSFANVKITVGSVVSAAGGIAAGTVDSYDAATNRLTIPAVQIGATTYTNVVITVGSLVSVGGSGDSQLIQTVQINQALGAQKNNNRKFVAGKSTVVRAFAASPVTVDAANTRAIVKRNGTTVATLAPDSYAGSTSVIDFQCPSLGACGDWAVGTYTFEVTLNGQTLAEPSASATYSYQFQERAALRILALPVKSRYNGTIIQVTDEKWKTMWQFTQRTYPVADNNVKWTIREEFDASDPKYDLETDTGRFAIWQALTNLQPPICSASPKDAGCYDLIVGFIPERPNTYPNGTLQGYTYGKPTNMVVAKDEDAAATVAHEIGHVYGLGDEYNGGSIRCTVNPTPDAFSGKDWDNRANTTSCSAAKLALPGVSTTLIPAANYPFEVGGRGALPDVGSFMGSGGLQSQFWVSQDDYDWLFDQLAPSAQRASRLRALSAPERFIAFSGSMKETGELTLNPWRSMTETLAIPDTTGDVMIRAVDASGTALASQALTLQYYVPATPPAPVQKIESAPFQGMMRFPAATTKFQIVKSGTVLNELAVSANAPVVSNVTPTAAMTLNGSYQLTWTASDVDRDKLYYTVEYNPDVTSSKSVWTVLIDDLETPSWTEDFSHLPGGQHAKIRVTADDGVLSTSALSAEFQVTAKPPEIFIVDSDAKGHNAAAGASDVFTYTVGSNVFLEAESYDLQDEWLPESGIRWTSSVAGAIGTGSKLRVSSLSVGTHVVTVTATNSAGLSSSDSVTVQIAAK